MMRLKKENIHRLFDQFSGMKVLVIGDVMLDSYIWGKVERISPEAPVPVVSVTKRENRLGGAANVALNLQSLGAIPVMCSVIGNDLKGNDLIGLFEAHQISTQGIIRSETRITTTKFRVIGNNHHLLRVDEEVESPLSTSDLKKMDEKISELIDTEKPAVIVFEDYDKGVITPELIQKVSTQAEKHHIPCVVDPKRKNFSSYRNVTLFKPNIKEFTEGLKLDKLNRDPEILKKTAFTFLEKNNIKILLLTMSEDGIFVAFRNDQNIFDYSLIPSEVRDVADVSGAGDTVVSIAALCLASGLHPFDLAYISNAGGGLVCEEVGVVPVSKGTLIKNLIEKVSA